MIKKILKFNEENFIKISNNLKILQKSFKSKEKEYKQEISSLKNKNNELEKEVQNLIFDKMKNPQKVNEFKILNYL